MGAGVMGVTAAGVVVGDGLCEVHKGVGNDHTKLGFREGGQLKEGKDSRREG